MSLKQFLGVNSSFVAIRGEKSPYGVKKHCVLPRFAGKPRFRAEAEQIVAPLAQLELVRREKVSNESSAGASPGPDRNQKAGLKQEASAEKPKRSLWSWLGFGIFRARPKTVPLVQAELSLDKVQVLRNDLRDADLEVVRKKEPQAPKVSATARWDTVEQQLPWTRLATRLFDSERPKNRIR